MAEISTREPGVYPEVFRELHPEFDSLAIHDAVMLAMRYGQYDGEPHTNAEIGRAIGLTRERVRQRLKQAEAVLAKTGASDGTC